MQIGASVPVESAIPMSPAAPTGTPQTDSRYADYKIIRRNGAVVGFAPSKIAIALTKAFIAVQGGQAAASARIRERVGVADRRRWSAPCCAASRMAAPSTSRTSRTRSNWR